ncbi:MAG: hypothetical protein AAGE65_13665 [Planctomycetota bacterium]
MRFQVYRGQGGLHPQATTLRIEVADAELIEAALWLAARKGHRLPEPERIGEKEIRRHGGGFLVTGTIPRDFVEDQIAYESVEE